jgi:hypothetical protein
MTMGWLWDLTTLIRFAPMDVGGEASDASARQSAAPGGADNAAARVGDTHSEADVM